MKRILCFILIVFVNSTLLVNNGFTIILAQERITFQKTFGGVDVDRGISVKQTADGGFVVIGLTKSFGAGDVDVYLIKTDANGDTSWSGTFGGTGSDNGWDVVQTRDKGYVLTGYTNSDGADKMDVFLIRVDAEGNKLWQKTFGGPGDDYSWSLQQTSEGGFIIAAQTGSSRKSEDVDAYLIKTDALGNEQWANRYGGSKTDRIFSVQQTLDGGFIAAGGTDSYGAGDFDIYIVKVNADGELVWEKTYGEEKFDIGHSVQQAADGGFVITGYGMNSGAEYNNAYLLKTDPSGDKIWLKTYGGEDDDRMLTGKQTKDGGFILTGYTKSFGSGAWDVYLIKTDFSGNLIWQNTFGGQYPDTGYTVIPVSDGGYILTGETWSFGSGRNDMLLIKINSDGNIRD